ncbi:MAG: hypothetical protein ACFFDH_01920 [Promethearchaeota archaeon]
MSKVYVCRECGYTFPEELSNLIKTNIQVYCERCGSPFIMEGVTFKHATTPYRKIKKPSFQLSKKKSSSLEKAIQILNKVSFIPLLLFTVISFLLILQFFATLNIGILFNRLMQSFIGLSLLIYDRTRIARKIGDKKYNDIFLDAFCWGILGCILYGLGVIILIKGILIIIYVITSTENEHFKKYDFGLLAKNSLNYFSAKAGLLIVLFGIFGIYANRIYLPESDTINIDLPFGIQVPVRLLIYFGFLLISLGILIIDLCLKKKTSEKREFKVQDVVKYFILGIFGLSFYSASIFILFKGILILFLLFGKPTEEIIRIPIEEKEVYYAPTSSTPPIPPKPPITPYKKVEELQKEIPKEQIAEISKIEEKPIRVEPQKIEERNVKELEKIPITIDKKEKAKREEEFKLKLHDSLLPVKDEKDKKLVKEYFSKIFAVLSKDLRKQIIDLKISKKERKEILEELVFLTKEEQVKYIEAIVNLYKEIPKRLTARIRKLPNVQPKHYDKILDQLKYMDYEEQIKFVQFLEENA